MLRIFFLVLLFCNCLCAESFQTPKRMQARVDFWVDVFTKYGEFQYVYHHRDYPGVVFDVLDLRRNAQTLSFSDTLRGKYIKKAKQDHLDLINETLKKLAEGKKADSRLERQIVDAVYLLPPARKGFDNKYWQIVKEEQVRSQTGIRERFEEAVRRSGRYLPIIEDIFVKEFNLPVELTRLPFVESSFNYQAYSSVGAAGIWQFMRSTARLYMKVNTLVDERRDVITATRAAAKYLKSAYAKLGSWPLAVTSYNHGVAGVSRKIKKYGSRDLTDLVEHDGERLLGFASNNFYPELLAAIHVYNRWQSYFPGLQREPAIKVSSYKLPHALSVKHITEQLGISTDQLKEYNYAISKRVWQGAYRVPAGYVLKVPQQYSTLLAKLKIPEPSSGTYSNVYGPGTYKVRSGDSLLGIARKYSISVNELKKLNNLKSDRIYIGQSLKVKKDEYTYDTSTYVVKSGDHLSRIAGKYKMSVSELKELNKLNKSTIYIGQRLKVKAPSKIYHRVQAGESLWSVSRKYNVSISTLKGLNHLKSSALRIGQTLRVK